MRINAIFEIVRDGLYSARFDGENAHELVKMFEQWNDAEYLSAFFLEHYADLIGFWSHMSVEEAILTTRSEANQLESELLRLACGTCGLDENLSMLFMPLSRHAAGDQYEKSKARGGGRKSWLRIYAVRVDVNLFVISGGAIKLTRTMNERVHLQKELEKLQCVCDYLKQDQGDEFGFFELIQ